MLSNVLTELLQPDSARVAAATSLLNPYLKNALCIGGLLQQIQGNPNAGVRQIAAVILRRRIAKLWGKLDGPSRATVQQAMLAVLQGEAEKPVRRSVVAVVAEVGKKCLVGRPETRWMNLLRFINDCCGAPHEEAREMGYMLLEQLAETISAPLQDLVPSLVVVFATGLQDATPLVQAAALRATCMLMQAMSTDEAVLSFKDLIPPMLEVLKARVVSGDDEVVREILEVMDELAQTPVPLLNPHVPSIVQMLLDMVKGEELESAIRDQASMVLGTLCEWKPKLLGKKQLVPQIIMNLLHMIANSEESAAGSLHLALADNMHDPADGEAGEEESDDESDDGMSSPALIAQNCLDKLGCSLPMKYVWPPALDACLQCMATGQSQWRKAGASALGNLAEGCQDPMREALQQVRKQERIARLDEAEATQRPHDDDSTHPILK